MDVSNATEEMTAIEELRAELTKRGVKWGNPRPDVTRYIDKYGVNCRVMPLTHDAVKVELYCLTPAQAIAATLGPETCHIEHYDTDILLHEDYYRCTACHSEIFFNLGYHFCPYCGAKVIEEQE